MHITIQSVPGLGGGSVPQWLQSLDHSPVEVFLTGAIFASSLHGQLIVILLKSPQMLLVPTS